MTNPNMATLGTIEDARIARSQAASWAKRFLDADFLWMEELQREFPCEDRGTVRFERRGEGAPGSALRAAFDKWKLTGRAWEASLKGDLELMDALEAELRELEAAEAL